MKKEIRQRLILVIMSVMSLLLIVVAVTFSWYTVKNYSNVDPISISTATPQQLKIIIDEEEPADQASINVDKNLKIPPVYSNGKIFLQPTEYDPYGKEISRSGDYVIYGEKPIKYELVCDDVSTCDCAYSINFSLMSVKRSYLFLDSKSSVSAGRNNVFSDNIAAAVRIGIYVFDDDEYKLVAIWIPNPTYQIKFADGNPYVDINGTVEDYYTFPEKFSDGNVTERKINTRNKKYGCEEITTRTSSLFGTKIIWGNIDEKSSDFEELTILETGITKIKMLVWIDGNDRECSSTTNGDISVIDGMYSLQDSEIKFDIYFGTYEVSDNE